MGGFLFDIPARYTPETRELPHPMRSSRGLKRSSVFGTTRPTTSIGAKPPASVPCSGIPTASRQSTKSSSATSFPSPARRWSRTKCEGRPKLAGSDGEGKIRNPRGSHG